MKKKDAHICQKMPTHAPYRNIVRVDAFFYVFYVRYLEGNRVEFVCSDKIRDYEDKLIQRKFEKASTMRCT